MFAGASVGASNSVVKLAISALLREMSFILAGNPMRGLYNINAASIMEAVLNYPAKSFPFLRLTLSRRCDYALHA